MMFYFVMLLLTTPHQHQHERQKARLTDALFCVSLQQKCSSDMTSIIHQAPFNKIIDETRVISTVSDMMSNGTFSKPAIEEYIKSIVTDILVNVTHSNIDYLLDKYSIEYYILVITSVSIGSLCMCMCLINYIFYLRNMIDYNDRDML